MPHPNNSAVSIVISLSIGRRLAAVPDTAKAAIHLAVLDINSQHYFAKCAVRYEAYARRVAAVPITNTA